MGDVIRGMPENVNFNESAEKSFAIWKEPEKVDPSPSPSESAYIFPLNALAMRRVFPEK